MTCDTGAVLLQLQSYGVEETNEGASVKQESVSQVAMEQADSVIKSIEVPHVPTQVPVSVIVHPSSSSSSEGSCDDESEAEQANGDKKSSKNVPSTKGLKSPAPTAA